MVSRGSVIGWVILGGLLHVGLPGQSTAQVTLDGTLGPRKVLDGPNYVIGSDLGQIRGKNLFHSFGDFNVRTGESATFGGPAAIQNILGRITGGNPSLIDGLLRSTIQGANLYLLNPRGVMFGPNASLDVSGSFHVTTADVIRFADGGLFPADPGRAAVLTVGDPITFGFLTAQQGSILVDRSQLRVPPDRTLSLVGGDVQIKGTTLSAPGGRLQIASVDSPGDVTPVGSGPSADLRLEGFSRLGATAISDSVLDVEASSLTTDPAGVVLIRGGQIVVQNSDINARGNPGGLLRIGAERLDLDGALVNTGTRGAADHPGMAVDLEVAGLATLRNGAEVASSSFGAGRAGGVRIVAGNLVMGDEKPATSPSAFTGDVGSRAFGAGQGGDVDITATSVTVRNGFFINTAALSTGAAGNVRVRADLLVILDGASISSNGFFLGHGGLVDISAGEILVSATNINSVPNGGFTGIAAQAGFGSPGGAIRVSADRVELLDGGRISTQLFSIGPGASVNITARELIISGVVQQRTAEPPDVHAGVDASVSGPFAVGRGGDIRVTADRILVTDGGFITSSAVLGAPGTGGDTVITAGIIEITNRGFIAASAVDGPGHAGTLTLQADRLTISGIADPRDRIGRDFTGLSTAAGLTARESGNLLITAGSIDVNNRGLILSSSSGSAAAGDIRIHAGGLSLNAGGAIIASAFGSGPGGTIDVLADSVSVAGAAPFVSRMDAGVSGIASQTATRGGNAGAILIVSGSLRVADGAKITTETFGSGAGGDIVISAGTVVVSGVDPALRSVDPSIASAAITASSNGVGRGGDILITSGHVAIASGGSILSNAQSSGRGGSIALRASRVELSDGTLSARSAGTGDAGNLTIASSGPFRIQDSIVTTQATTADGGNIVLTAGAGSLVDVLDSRITTSVQSGQGKGGNITIDPQFVILDHSQVRADAFGGPGGNIDIAADVFLASESIISASSALNTPGTINIQASVTDLSGSVAALPAGPLQAATLLRASCAARVAAGKASSLVVTGREGLPLEPGGYLPSPWLAQELGNAVSSNREGHPYETFPLFSRSALAPGCSR